MGVWQMIEERAEERARRKEAKRYGEFMCPPEPSQLARKPPRRQRHRVQHVAIFITTFVIAAWGQSVHRFAPSIEAYIGSPILAILALALTASCVALATFKLFARAGPHGAVVVGIVVALVPGTLQSGNDTNAQTKSPAGRTTPAEPKPKPKPSSTRVIAQQRTITPPYSDQEARLRAIVQGLSNSCSSVPPTAWPGLWAAIDCAPTPERPNVGKATYYRFGLLEDAKSFFHHAIPPGSQFQSVLTCGEPAYAVGLWYSSPTSVVSLREDLHIVEVVWQRAHPDAALDRADWALSCSPPISASAT